MVRSRKWEGEVIQIMDVGKECIRSGSHLSKGLVSIPCQVSADKAESYESSECSARSLSLSLCSRELENHGTSKENVH